LIGLCYSVAISLRWIRNAVNPLVGTGMIVSMKIRGETSCENLFEVGRVVWYAQFNASELDGDASGRVASGWHRRLLLGRSTVIKPVGCLVFPSGSLA
jgi:hypothetical protein